MSPRRARSSSACSSHDAMPISPYSAAAAVARSRAASPRAGVYAFGAVTGCAHGQRPTRRTSRRTVSRASGRRRTAHTPARAARRSPHRSSRHHDSRRGSADIASAWPAAQASPGAKDRQSGGRCNGSSTGDVDLPRAAQRYRLAMQLRYKGHRPTAPRRLTRALAKEDREPPKSMYPAGSGIGAHGPDHLTFDLADAAKLSLSFYGKRPGPGMRRDKLSMQFAMHDTEMVGEVLEAYERLILDVMRDDRTLFTTAEGIERLWEVSTPLLERGAIPTSRAPDPGCLGLSSALDERRPRGDAIRV